MLITFVGTDKGNNSAKKAAALTAGLLSLSNGNRVCLLQLGYDTKDMVSLLIGKEKTESAVSVLDTFGTTEIMKGLDALMSKANTESILSADTLYSAADAMITTENRFDVMLGSKKESFDTELKSNMKFASLKKVLTSMTASENDVEAEIPYDFVVLYIPNNCPRLGELVALSDINVCCVRQGEREEPLLNDTKNVFLITHYETESVYDVKYIKKAYAKDCSKAQVFPMLHNVSFKDACMGMNLRKWLVKNYAITEDDDNYEFVSKMQKFVNYISDTEQVYEPDPTPLKRQKKKKEKTVKQRKEKKAAPVEQVQVEDIQADAEKEE